MRQGAILLIIVSVSKLRNQFCNCCFIVRRNDLGKAKRNVRKSAYKLEFHERLPPAIASTAESHYD